MANFHLVIGHDPTKLEPVQPAHIGLPKSLEDAIRISQAEHPAILAALNGVDAADLNVKISEGALYPTISLVGQLQKSYNSYNNITGSRSLVASIIGQISVPLYDGGTTTATIRQSKESSAQQHYQADYQRAQVRAAVVSCWGVLANSKAIIEAAQLQVSASETALKGTRDEANAGQRTTLDVLNAQQTFLNSRVSLVSAQRDQIVASYALLVAVGRLSPANLALNATRYDPSVHYDLVKNEWYGLRPAYSD